MFFQGFSDSYGNANVNINVNVKGNVNVNVDVNANVNGNGIVIYTVNLAIQCEVQFEGLGNKKDREY